MNIGKVKLIKLLNKLERNFEKDLPEEIRNYSYIFNKISESNEEDNIFNYVFGYGETDILLKNNVVMRNRIIKKIDNLKYVVIYEFVKWMKVIINSDGTKNVVYCQNPNVPTDIKEVA